ncbi:KTSC domain-containing protein [Mesorhizobium sp.]|uniref:KTSC domain-containing protein n=1 Tax=Mesorhizobium sp. TaxID=1871066 RepID=UPI00257F7EE8|nr:KTSC domain-containing protein [Mesorhizobium sp.]
MPAAFCDAAMREVAWRTSSCAARERYHEGTRPPLRSLIIFDRAAVMPSTSIRKTEYDPESRILSVWFVASGKRYEFEGVPPETFAAFKAAFAKDRYFNEHIRNHFRYRLVGPAVD